MFLVPFSFNQLLISQKDLLRSEQQPHVLGQAFTRIDDDQGARVNLWDFVGSNGCPSKKVARDQNHEERLQCKTTDTDSHHTESVWNDGKDVKVWRTNRDGLSRASWLQNCGSTYNRFLLSLRIIRICGEPNYNWRGWRNLCAKDSSRRTLNTTTGDRWITSFALHWEFAKHFCCATSYSIRRKENNPCYFLIGEIDSYFCLILLDVDAVQNRVLRLREGLFRPLTR